VSDTTTTLNPGAAGDVMDESLALQGDGLTSAKRPRVTIGGDVGFDGTKNDLVQPVRKDPGASPASLPVLGVALVGDTMPTYVDSELRPLSVTNDGRLRTSTSPARVDMVMFEPAEHSMWGELSVDPTQNSSPWNQW
jgi:hypothetical protein